jgi:small-conductance mechanosensitive channel
VELASLDSFWNANEKWISAAVTLLLTIALAYTVDRAFAQRGLRLAQTVTRGGLSREADTRLRFVRRLVYATILLIGLALAASQFTGVNRIAASVLASGVVAAAIVGFAARQTLANFVAGVMLAITQPIRVGDWITFDEHHGEVEDVRLNYTVVRGPGNERVMIPNERLAGGIIVNDTLAVERVGYDVDVWIPPGADAERAVEALRAEVGDRVTIAESAPSGVRLSVSGGPVPAAEKGAHEAQLRFRCLARLQAEGLLEGFTPQART